MLYPHTFHEGSHEYRVPGSRVLATSDVIYLNGLYDVSQIPPEKLEFAGHRGSALHLAIRAYETGVDDTFNAVARYAKERMLPREYRERLYEAVNERMLGYYRFRDKHEVKLLGGDDALAPDEMEVSRVYEHKPTGVLIGATIDFPCYVDGALTIVDLKSSFLNCGKKAMQDMLKWRLQLQSYREVLTEDDELWKRVKKPRSIKKAILHLHPSEKKGGFEYHVIGADDRIPWRAAVQVAQLKLNNGFKLDERRH